MADESKIHAQFPVYPRQDFDMQFRNLPHPIGLMSTAPAELRRRVIAAAISHQLQLKSIDYTYKRYMKEAEYRMSDRSRLDLRATRAIESWCDHLHALIYYVTGDGEKPLGTIIGEWTMLRLPHSLLQLLTLANRGTLYEACAVSRMILEQVAWAVEIDGLDDENAIARVKAEGSIRVLKTKVLNAGKYYGWLSSHTHWRYDGHIKAFEVEEEQIMATLLSSRFKAISLASILLLLVTVLCAVKSMKLEAISRLAVEPAGGKIRIGKAVGEPEPMFSTLFGPRTVSVKETLELLSLLQPAGLLREIAELTLDNDIIFLSNMGHELAKQTAVAF